MLLYGNAFLSLQCFVNDENGRHHPDCQQTAVTATSWIPVVPAWRWCTRNRAIIAPSSNAGAAWRTCTKKCVALQICWRCNLSPILMFLDRLSESYEIADADRSFNYHDSRSCAAVFQPTYETGTRRVRDIYGISYSVQSGDILI